MVSGQRLPGSARQYLRPTRGQVFVIGIHLVAFGLLYLSIVGMMEREILFGHTSELREKAQGAVGLLHDVLQSGSLTEVRRQAEAVRLRLGLDSLEIADAEGLSLTGGGEGFPLLSRHHEQMAPVEQVQVETAGGRWTLSGAVRLDASQHCGPCHQEGMVLGVARVGLDLSPQVERARGRVRRQVGILVAAWLVVLAALNLVARRVAQRWLRRLRSGLATGQGLAEGSPHGFPVDPISRQIYQSLTEVMGELRAREDRAVDRMQHADKLASLGQVAAGLAHEIKNPLAGLHGALELLRDESRNSDRRNLYDQMIGEIDRVNAILHQLLRFSRPGPLRRAETDVASLIEEAAALLQHGLQRKRIRLVTEIAPGLPPFPLDVGQIKQVIVNLVANAGEAIGEDGSITIRASGFPDGEGLILAVEDSGPGMEEDLRARIFEPFFTTKFTGTGLGLAVSRSLVEQHGGSLEVRSEPGGGSTFFVLLPRPVPASELPDTGSEGQPKPNVSPEDSSPWP